MKRVLDLPVQFKVVSSRRAFSTLIEQRRKQLGLNQTELGRRLRVKQQQVSKWEKGETLPDSKRLTSLAKALEMDVNDLYAAHAAASEAEARQARRTSDELMARLERFSDRYEELGHTYAANHGMLNDLLGMVGRILERLDALEARYLASREDPPPAGGTSPPGRRTRRPS